jgi:hypothetical protein
MPILHGKSSAGIGLAEAAAVRDPRICLILGDMSAVVVDRSDGQSIYAVGLTS